MTEIYHQAEELLNEIDRENGVALDTWQEAVDGGRDDIMPQDADETAYDYCMSTFEYAAAELNKILGVGHLLTGEEWSPYNLAYYSAIGMEAIGMDIVDFK